MQTGLEVVNMGRKYEECNEFNATRIKNTACEIDAHIYDMVLSFYGASSTVTTATNNNNSLSTFHHVQVR